MSTLEFTYGPNETNAVLFHFYLILEMLSVPILSPGDQFRSVEIGSDADLVGLTAHPKLDIEMLFVEMSLIAWAEQNIGTDFRFHLSVNPEILVRFCWSKDTKNQDRLRVSLEASQEIKKMLIMQASELEVLAARGSSKLNKAMEDVLQRARKRSALSEKDTQEMIRITGEIASV